MMEGSLGAGLRAIQGVAQKECPVVPEKAPWRDKLWDELAQEAQKFVIFRIWRMRDRELLSLQRLRSLATMLKRAA